MSCLRIDQLPPKDKVQKMMNKNEINMHGKYLHIGAILKVMLLAIFTYIILFISIIQTLLP